MSEILIFLLVFVAEQAGLNLLLLTPRRQVFSHRSPFGKKNLLMLDALAADFKADIKLMLHVNVFSGK